MRRVSALIIAALLMLTQAAHSDELTHTAKQQFLRAIITQTYQPAMRQLRAAHTVLSGQLANNCNSGEVREISVLQQKWIDVYQQWKRVESYTFGPVSFKHLSRQIGFWPTRYQFLQMLVLGDSPMTSDTVSGLSIATKGYPALEWIFFTRFEANLPARENQRYCQLSQLLSVEIQQLLTTVEAAYQAPEFLQVLNGERELTLAESAFSYEPFSEWLNTIIATQYELRKLYLIRPAGLRPATRILPESVDAYPSQQSRVMLLARWQALKNIYLGTGDGPALANLLAQAEASLALELRQAVASVDLQLLQLPPVDLSTLVLKHHALLVALNECLLNLESLLLNQVTAALGTPSLFINNDGD